MHGYHPWAEDAAIYIPGVEKLLNPKLFPFNSQFFESHAQLTFFPELIAGSVRLSHLPLPWVLFFWHLLSVFLLFFACLELAGRCFARKTSCYAGVALVGALLTLPVAGTALYIMDQYCNPRNLTAFIGILAIARLLDRKYVTVALLLLCALAIHPLMATFAIFFCALLFCMEKFERHQAMAMFAGLLPLGLLDSPPTAYHAAAAAHSYFYPLRWHWYEWLGVIGPVLIFIWFYRIGRSRGMRNLAVISQTFVVYELIFVMGAFVVSVPARTEGLVRLQPMRSLYLLYIVFILFSGGLLGEYVLKGRSWKWLVIFLPLCGGMFYAQEALFPASPHLEWPGLRERNPWAQAFAWARSNTPSDAIFALNPHYIHIPGEDTNSFRAISERSMLADWDKDGGAVSMFPEIAEEWLTQVQAQSGWQNFQPADFRRLRTRYGVKWVVLQQPAGADLPCPYQNQTVKICKVE